MEKIHFKLQQDEGGYPPASVESMWACRVGPTEFIVDNVPFFIRGIAMGDRIEALNVDGRLWFQRKLSSSGHATFRLLFLEHSQLGPVREELREMGCSSELSHLPKLISVDVPPPVNYDDVLWAMMDLQELGICEIEESCLPHSGA